MTPKQLFRLAVRILGLVFFYHGVSAIPVAIPGVFTALMGRSPLALLSMVLMVGWPLLVSIWLLTGASFLVNLVFSHWHETEDSGTGGQPPFVR